MSEEPRGNDCDMDCDDAIEHLYTFLDGELTAVTEGEVREHLERCRGCFGQFEFERLFLQFLEARCRASAAPDHLRRRVFQRILLELPGETP